jgi:hypothetical protein
MKDMITISKALEDLREYYGLDDIKHVTVNMEKDDPEITFVSNRPKQLTHMKRHDKHMLPKYVKYVLKLEIRVDSLFKEEN